jgi:nitroreductase
MDLIEKLNWRYAVKRYSNAKVPPEKLNHILEAIQLSASSIGLQPYNVLVIENEELRKKLLPAANNQLQIIEASHLIVFAAWENISTEKIDQYIERIAEVRGVTTASLADFKSKMAGIPTRTAEQNFNWAARQTYIALGTGLVAAALENVDASPMEGFNAAEFDKILNLNERGLKSVSIMAIGYRDAEKDPFSKFKKVRWPKEQLFIHF